MTASLWLFLGAVAGLCAGVLLMALLTIARDPGPIANPHGNEDDRDHLAERVRDQLNAQEGVVPIYPAPTGLCLSRFRSAMCGYDGPIQHCDKTFASCCAKGNEKRFWG